MAVSAPLPSPDPSPASPRRRIWWILAVWIVAVGAALLLASALDDPVGSGERDAAQPAAPDAVADPAAGLAEGLPPLTLILDRALPDGIGDLAPIRQAARLERLAQSTGDARRYTELGTVLQTLGDPVGATAAYRSALRAGGDGVAADAGLAMLEATRGGDGPERAAERLGALSDANPRSQLVAFNQGWLAIYRSQPDVARAAWNRVIALGPDERLGQVSRALIASLEQGAGGRNP